MAGGNLSPRQKMINMMYLVLTALLALNVSKEVLNSFFEVNKGIERTTNNFNTKNASTYSAFKNAASNNPEKYQEVSDKAHSIKNKVDDISIFIQEMKYDLVAESDKNKVYFGTATDIYNADGKLIEELAVEDKKFSELDLAQQYMPIAYLKDKGNRYASQDLFYPNKLKPGAKKRATELKEKLKGYRDFLIPLTEGNENLKASINKVFQLEGNLGKKKNQSWEQYNFVDMPSVSALTILSKIQSDLRNTEADVIDYLKRDIDSKSLKFTAAEGIQIPTSNFVITSDSFRSEIFITAQNPDQNPDIFVGDFDSLSAGEYKMRGEEGIDYERVSVKNGKGLFARKTSSTGVKKWGGLILMKTETGTKTYPFRGEYLVAPKTVVVSPTFMNVLYVKVENKITVSVPGYSASQVTARAKDGSSCTPVNKNKGEWLVTPIKENRKNAPFIQLFVTDDGKKKSMGWVEFRILDVPKPEAQAAGIDKDITIVSRDELKGAQMLKATLGEDFLLDPKAVQFGITGFEVEYSNSNGNFVAKQKNGATFNKDVEQAIATTSAGGLMRFTNIKAKRRGYKKVYPLKPLTFKIK
jgi:gliding motility-associated protein GldM